MAVLRCSSLGFVTPLVTVCKQWVARPRHCLQTVWEGEQNNLLQRNTPTANFCLESDIEALEQQLAAVPPGPLLAAEPQFFPESHAPLPANTCPLFVCGKWRCVCVQRIAIQAVDFDW